MVRAKDNAASDSEPPSDEGRRERKKRETRQAIADTAMRLFYERGFDEVTVSEVARAADVSEQTVYNYFPTKEALAFNHMPSLSEELVAGFAAQKPGASVTAPFRAQTRNFLKRVASEPEAVLRTSRLIWRSNALRTALMAGWDAHAQAIARAIGQSIGAKDGDLLMLILANTLTWTHRTILRTATGRLEAGESPAKVARALEREARRAYDLLDRGLARH
ncbi:MAG: TetR family transcriptional regulator [Myxococcota bacterium]